MCGITGFLGPSDKALLRAMCESLVHRGPDDSGYYTSPEASLAMRRLAIIDVEKGQQPMTNENRDVWVILNGEIYNYQTLRKTLLDRGHLLRSHSDTETVAHLYEDYGLDFVHHLRGMFSIAVWDANLQRLVLVRDRIGEKPLYYAPMEDRLYFGSEIKAILCALRSRTVHAQAVCDFLSMGYVAGDRTFYREILKLPPGSMLVQNRNTREVEVKAYWKPKIQGVSDVAYAPAREALESKLEDAVGLCLKSDVEVGAFLSGGLDSSAVVSLMRKHSARVKTFSVGYGGAASGFNELKFARRVSEVLGTQHKELILGAESNLELLPKIIRHFDEPHGEPTSVLVYLLCEFVREEVKVALSGTGADEIFYGYPRHRGLSYLRQYQRVPATLRKALLEKALSKFPESTRGSRLGKRVNRFIQGSELSPEEAYLTWVRLILPSLHRDLVSSGTKDEAMDSAGDAFLRFHLIGAQTSRTLLDRVCALDVTGYLPEYQLTYMDRMSMAHGLEVRSPLCDYQVVEYVTSLPNYFRLKGGRSKHIFKDVAKQWIPKDIAERKKVGFDSPIGQWFKHELKAFLLEFLSPYHLNRSGLLNVDTVQRVIQDHLLGRKDYSLQLWSILALEIWYRMYIEDGVSGLENVGIRDIRGGEAVKHK